MDEIFKMSNDLRILALKLDNIPQIIYKNNMTIQNIKFAGSMIITALKSANKCIVKIFYFLAFLCLSFVPPSAHGRYIVWSMRTSAIDIRYQ